MEQDVYKTVAMNIRKYRRQRQMTQAQLAERIGKTVEMVCQIENSMAGTKLSTLELVAKAFGVEVYQLLLPEGYADCPRVSSKLLTAINLFENKPVDFLETLNKFFGVHKK